MQALPLLGLLDMLTGYLPVAATDLTDQSGSPGLSPGDVNLITHTSMGSKFAVHALRSGISGQNVCVLEN